MLDDPQPLAGRDRYGMVEAARRFPEQWDEAQRIPLPDMSGLPQRPPRVVFAGMGGSGTGAEFASAFLDAEGRTVARVVHDYALPAWLAPDTLVIATSYSGGTEETLAGIATAQERGAPWLAITTGGALAEAAARHGAPVVTVPGGLQPRAAFGYLTVLVLRALVALDLLDEGRTRSGLARAGQRIREVAEACDPKVPERDNPAKQLARALNERHVLVVADQAWAAAAERVRCQLNENSKVLAFTRILPEANHNDTVAWSRAHHTKGWAALFLGAFDRLPPIQERAAFLHELFAGRSVPVLALDVPDDDPVARMVATAYQADWVSLYLAALNGVDPGEVDVIRQLKERVARTGHVDYVRKQLGV